MTEVQVTLLAFVGFVIINIIGWYMSYRANAHKSDINTGVEQQKDTQRDYRVDNLPCQLDPGYLIRQGQLLQKVEDIQLRLHRIEDKLNHKS